MRQNRSTGVFVVFAVLSLLFAACADGGGGEASTTTEVPDTTPASTVAPTTTLPTTTLPTSVTTTTPAGANGMIVYFLLESLDEEAAGPYLVPVYREASAGVDTVTLMESLLSGPTPDETSGIPAIATAIPEGTEVLNGQVESGVAEIDLSDVYDDGGGSASMFARLAQVVYTLTGLSDVEEVSFAIEGQVVTTFSAEGIELEGPQARDDYYDWLPPIFVDSPAWGEPVSSPFVVSGLSNVFEAVSQVMLTDDDGAPLFEDTVIATCGTGCWGEWETEIEYEVDRPQFGALIVWEYSAQDGSRINVREYPLRLE